MEIYLVGGAVRDKQLGLAVQDADYVVVGATPEEMTARGFRMVGADFPVFLHPRPRRSTRWRAPSARAGAAIRVHRVRRTDVTLEDDLGAATSPSTPWPSVPTVC